MTARRFLLLFICLNWSPLAQGQTMAGSPTFMPTPSATPAAPPTPTEQPRPSSGTPAGDAALAFAAGDLTHADVLYRAAYQMGERNPAIVAARAQLALWQGKLSEAENLAHEIDLQAPEAKVATDVLRIVAQRRNEDIEDVYHKTSTAPTTITLFGRDPVPLVIGTINGRAAGLVVDTGAEQVTVSDSFAKMLGMPTTLQPPPPGAPKAAGGAAHGVLDRVEVGELRVTTVPVMIVPARQIAAISPAADGVIGLGFLARFRVTIDYAHSQLILAPRNSAPKSSQSIGPVQLWLVGGHELFVEAAIGGAEPCMWRIDTGRKGPAVTVRDRAYLEQAGVLSTPPSPSPRPHRLAKAATMGLTLPLVHLGEVAARDVPAELVSKPDPGEGVLFKVGGVLSLGFFKPWSIAFDFEKMQLWLDTSQ